MITYGDTGRSGLVAWRHSEISWHSPEGNFAGNSQNISHWYEIETDLGLLMILLWPRLPCTETKMLSFLTKFPPLTALKVVKMITSSAASDENAIKIMHFHFHGGRAIGGGWLALQSAVTRLRGPTVISVCRAGELKFRRFHSRKCFWHSRLLWYGGSVQRRQSGWLRPLFPFVLRIWLVSWCHRKICTK